MDLSNDNYIIEFTPKQVVNRHFDMYEKRDIIAKFVMESLEAFYKKNIINGPKHAFEHLVDVACGSGRQTIEFQSYFSRITGVDISDTQVALAEKVYSKMNDITFATGSAEKIPVDDASADVIISISAAHFFDMEKFAEECLRVLKPNGVVVLYGHRADRVVIASAINIDQKLISDSTELWLNAELKLGQHMAEVSHPEWNVFDRFQKLYNDIQSMKKSRDDSKKFDMEMSLLELKMYYDAIPFFCYPKSKSIMEDAWRKLKERWQVQHLADDDIIVNRRNDVFILTLSKQSADKNLLQSLSGLEKI